MERDLLRGNEEGCLSQVRQGHLYKAINEYGEESGNAIEEACSMLQVFRAAYYRWISEKKSARTAENEIIAEKIEQIHKESYLDPYRYLLWVLRNAPALSGTDEFWAEKLTAAKAPQKCKTPQ